MPGRRAPRFPQSHRWVETVLAGEEEGERLYSFAVGDNTGKPSWSLSQIWLTLGLEKWRRQGMAQEWTEDRTGRNKLFWGSVLIYSFSRRKEAKAVWNTGKALMFCKCPAFFSLFANLLSCSSTSFQCHELTTWRSGNLCTLHLQRCMVVAMLHQPWKWFYSDYAPAWHTLLLAWKSILACDSGWPALLCFICKKLHLPCIYLLTLCMVIFSPLIFCCLIAVNCGS